MISDSNDAYSPDVEVIATSTGLPASFGGNDTTELPFALRDNAQDQDQEGYFDRFSKRNKIMVGLSTFLLVLCVSIGTGIAVKNNTVSNFAVLKEEEDCPEPLLISSAKGSKAPSTAKAKSKAPSSASAKAEGGTKAHITHGSKCSKSTKSSKSSKSSAPSSRPSLGPSESAKPSAKPSLGPSELPSAKPSLSLVPSELPSASAKPSLSLVPSESELPSASAKPSLSLVPSESPSASVAPSQSAKPSATCIASGEFCERTAERGSRGFCRNRACCAGSIRRCEIEINSIAIEYYMCGSRSGCPTAGTCIASGKFCGRQTSQTTGFCRNACCFSRSNSCNKSPLPGRYCDLACPV